MLEKIGLDDVVVEQKSVPPPDRDKSPVSPYRPPPLEQKKCLTCNAVIHRQAELCPHCGVLQTAPPPDRDKSQVSPYQSPTVSLTDADRHTTEIELADRGTRLTAVMVNIFILGAALFVFMIPVSILHLDSDAFLGQAVVALVIIGVIMTNWVLLYRYGQSIGKRLLSIKIVDVDGSRAGLLRILLLRYLVISILSVIPIIGILNLLLIFQNSRRCLHDIIAQTIVIKVFPGKNDSPYGSLTGAIGAITLVVMVPFLLFVAMIPAYTDYVKKGKVSEAVELLGGLKTPAEEYLASTGEFPPTIYVVTYYKASGKYVANLVSNPEEFYFEATMRKEDTVLGGKVLRLIYHPDTKMWSCSAAYPNGIPQKYLPSACK